MPGDWTSGGDTAAQDEDGLSAVYWAAVYNRVEEVITLIQLVGQCWPWESDKSACNLKEEKISGSSNQPEEQEWEDAAVSGQDGRQRPTGVINVLKG